MRYLSAWAAGTVFAAVIIGCGPGKQLPDEIPKTQGNERGEPKESVPTISDAAAKEIVERAIKAHTQGNPALLAKGKLCKVTSTGSIKTILKQGDAPTPIPSGRTFLTRWPDHIRYTVVSQGSPSFTTTLIQRGSFSWFGRDTASQPISDPQKFEEIMLTESYGLQWLPLLFPLTEPKTVVFEARKGVGTPPADTIRVAIPDRPIYRLHFDPATSYLTKVEYTHTDTGGRALKEWLLSDYKPFDGFLLPTQLKMARTPDRTTMRDVVEEWVVEKWEFPDKIDDSAFEPPK